MISANHKSKAQIMAEKQKEKVTIGLVAKEAGVSPATVSRAMRHPEMVSPDTLKRVNESINALGYAGLSSQPASRPTNRVIVANIPWLENPFYSEIVRGIREAANEDGIDTIISWDTPTVENVNRFCSMLRHCNASGIITLSPLTPEVLMQIEDTIPVVQCAECNEQAGIPFVTIDDHAAARTAVEHLISCGCKRLALVGGPQPYKYAKGRREGFLEVLHEHGLEVRSEWMLQVPNNSYSLAYSSVSHMLDSEELPDGVFACSDTYASATVNAARRSGINVPSDLMVVGFDNTDTAVMASPSLTTISQPRYQMGYSACSLLLERLHGGKPDVRSMYLDTELVVRESTAPK